MTVLQIPQNSFLSHVRRELTLLRTRGPRLLERASFPVWVCCCCFVVVVVVVAVVSFQMDLNLGEVEALFDNSFVRL